MNRFALDWLPKDNVLTVLFGHDASAVVRLHIDPGYPTNGDVTVLSAGGLPEGTTISQLRVGYQTHCEHILTFLLFVYDKLSETEPKWFVFKTSRYAFGGRNCIESVA